jgi:hypothetical protein
MSCTPARYRPRQRTGGSRTRPTPGLGDAPPRARSTGFCTNLRANKLAADGHVGLLVLVAPAPAGRAQSGSLCSARRAAGIPAKTSDGPYRHRIEHVLHARADVVHGDGLDLVFAQEPRHPGVRAPSVPWSCSVPQPTVNSCQPRISPAVTSATATRSALPHRGSTWPSALPGTHALTSNASSPQPHLAATLGGKRYSHRTR